MIKTVDILKYKEDFPIKGVKFVDVMPILANPEVFKRIIKWSAGYFHDKVDAIVGLESRGFLFGTTLAYELEIPFIPIRKKGKLPFAQYKVDYKTEYSTETIEIGEGLKEHERVLIFDDLLATGGTLKAAYELVLQYHPKSVSAYTLIDINLPEAEDVRTIVFNEYISYFNAN